MATPTRTTTWVDGNTLTASALNGEFNNLMNAPAIMNADIASNAAIATSKINATFPTGTIVGTTDTQVLSAKTLTKPIINASVQGIATYTPSGGGTATIDGTSNNVHSITMPAGNITIAVSNITSGQVFTIIIKQDSGGSRTVSWFGSIKWTGAVAPTLTTTGSRYDIFAFLYDGTNYYGSIVGLNFG